MKHQAADSKRIEGDSANAVPFGKRLMSLDGLRGIAILAVIAEHTLRLFHPTSVLSRLWAAFQESSWAGVDLFFVLSGFLITGILLDSRHDKRYFLNFYARRTLRIFPLYYAVLVIAILIVPAVMGFSKLPELYSRLVANQLWLWTYLQNFAQASGPHALPGFGHFWSLAVEEQFYWVWPLAVFLLPRRHLFRLCITLCAFLPRAAPGHDPGRRTELGDPAIYLHSSRQPDLGRDSGAAYQRHSPGRKLPALGQSAGRTCDPCAWSNSAT